MAVSGEDEKDPDFTAEREESPLPLPGGRIKNPAAGEGKGRRLAAGKEAAPLRRWRQIEEVDGCEEDEIPPPWPGSLTALARDWMEAEPLIAKARSLGAMIRGRLASAGLLRRTEDPVARGNPSAWRVRLNSRAALTRKWLETQPLVAKAKPYAAAIDLKLSRKLAEMRQRQIEYLASGREMDAGPHEKLELSPRRMRVDDSAGEGKRDEVPRLVAGRKLAPQGRKIEDAGSAEEEPENIPAWREFLNSRLAPMKEWLEAQPLVAKAKSLADEIEERLAAQLAEMRRRRTPPLADRLARLVLDLLGRLAAFAKANPRLVSRLAVTASVAVVIFAMVAALYHSDSGRTTSALLVNEAASQSDDARQLIQATREVIVPQPTLDDIVLMSLEQDQANGEFAAGRYEAAEAIYLNILQHSFSRPLQIYHIIACALLEGRRGVAEALLQAELPAPPPDTSPAWYYSSAIMLLMDGKSSQAWILIMKAESLYPFDCAPYRSALRPFENR